MTGVVTGQCSAQMKDAAYHGAENDPEFVAYIIKRLSEIPGSSWRSDPPPWHTTYDDWHVLGSIRLPWDALKDKSLAPQSDSGKSTDSQEEENGGSRGSYPVAARVSTYSLRLERQYQLQKTLLDEFDPLGQRHIRALELFKLPGRSHDEVSLTVILMEYPGEENFDT